jgi:acyl dehydratase
MTKTFSQFEPGEKFITKSRIITPADIDIFARITGYDDRFFLDAEFAKSLGFKTRFAPGGLTFCVSIGLLAHSGHIDDVIAYMGANKLWFTTPVYPYDILHVEGELIDRRITKDPERGIIHYKWLTKNQRDETVIDAENTCMFLVNLPW